MTRAVARLLALLALTLTGCRAVESITKTKTGFYESPCHPGIYLTDEPPNASPECKWSYVQHQ